MVLQYVYHDEKSTLSVDWHDINGKFTIHTTIVERLTSRHGNSFKEYKMAAQELDRKVDKLIKVSGFSAMNTMPSHMTLKTETAFSELLPTFVPAWRQRSPQIVLPKRRYYYISIRQSKIPCKG